MTFPYRLVDLTHTLDANTISWNGKSGFQDELKLDYSQCTGAVKFRIKQFKMHAGIGTHMDAPAHCIANGLTIDQIKITNLIAPCFVLDISNKAHAHYSLSPQDIQQFESQYGLIPSNSFVMVKTGWERFWSEPDKYRNNYAFPSVSKEAAAILIQRNVQALGIDTLSPDRPEDGFHTHQLFLENNKYIVENSTNLDLLPIVGSFILTCPIKVKDATEAPVRLIGLI